MSETTKENIRELYPDLPPSFYYLIQGLKDVEINIRNEFERKIDKLKVNLKAEIKELETNMKEEMKKLKMEFNKTKLWSITSVITIILSAGATIASVLTR